MSRLMEMRNLDIHDPLVLQVDYLLFFLYKLLSLIQIVIISAIVIPVFTAHVHSTMGGYVFTGVCLFRRRRRRILVPGVWSPVLSGEGEWYPCLGPGHDGRGYSTLQGQLLLSSALICLGHVSELVKSSLVMLSVNFDLMDHYKRLLFPFKQFPK